MGNSLLIILIILLIVGIATFIYFYPNTSPTGRTLDLIDKGVERTQEVIDNISEEIQEEIIEPIEDEEDNNGGDEPIIEPPPIQPEVETTTQPIKIANFNAQIFGDSKWTSLGGNFYIPLIEEYDIFFLQEIRDKDGSSFTSLCNGLQGYQCQVSSRAGRSSSKEQVGVIYKDGITATLTDYNPDAQNRWERPPIEVDFYINGYEITAWNIHIKPDDVENEINALESIVSDEGNVIVLGDLNLDCTYDDGSNGDFEGWNYLINDNEDTTTKSTDCAYDRIILNDNAYQSYESDGIDTSITEDESDHYLVWVELFNQKV